MLDRIYSTLKFDKDKILNIYPYGSRVYGTDTYKSDWDFIVVANVDMHGEEFRRGDLNVHVYNPDGFQRNINEHKIYALECIFLPDKMKIQENKKFTFKVDLPILRREFSQKASNSWVKCKKKLEVENEPYIGLKSLFHSLRIIKYGIQLAKTGEIHDYTEANQYFHDIMNSYRTDWEYFKNIYQPIYNNLSTDFKLLAPI